MTPALRIERVAFDDPDAVSLRAAMVAEVGVIYGGQRDRGTSGMPTAVEAGTVVLTLLARAGDVPVGHALLRRLGDDLEIKRMFVAPEARGLGAADALMRAMEDEARRLGAPRLILHTGDRQVAAVRTYQRHGFTPIPVYEPYVGMPASLCFEKLLG